MEESTLTGVLTFVESFAKNRSRYRNFALRFTHNPDAAAELVSESIARLWEKRNEIVDGNIEAYFYTSLKFACLDWLRNKQTKYKVHNDIFEKSYRLLQYDIRSLETFDPNLIFSSEIREIMLRQLDKMPELTRRVFVDNRFCNLSYEQIAGKYSISTAKVEREIQSVLSRLRIALKDYLPSVLSTLILMVCLTGLW